MADLADAERRRAFLTGDDPVGDDGAARRRAFLTADDSAPASTPPPAGEPGVWDFLAGAGKLVAAGLAGGPGGMNQRHFDRLSERWNQLPAQQQEAVKEYGPVAGVVAASTMVPGGVVAQGLANVAVNSASDAWSAYRKGEDPLEAAIPKADARTAISLVAPAAIKHVVAPGIRGVANLGRAVKRGLTAPSLAGTPSATALNETLEAAPGAFEWSPPDAMRIDAPLRPVPKVPLPVAEEPMGMLPGLPAPRPVPLLPSPAEELASVPPAAKPLKFRDLVNRVYDRAVGPDMGVIDAIRTGFSSPARFMRRSTDAVAKATGQLMEEHSLTEERLRTTSKAMLSKIFPGIDDVGRKEVTAILDGSKPLEEASSPAIGQAAARMREYYDQWANVLGDTKLPLMNKATGQVGDFARRENYSPRILAESLGISPRKLRGVFKKQTIAYSRVPEATNEKYLTDALDIARAYADKYARMVATHRTFGSAMPGSKWGDTAKGIYQYLETNPDLPVPAAMFNDAMDQLYSGVASPAAKGLARLNSRIVQSILGGSWATQLGQLATPIRQYGLDNTVEGLIRYRRDPYLRALIDSSGARDPGYSDLIRQYTNQAGEGLPIRAIGTIEKFLRGPMNAGVVPYVERLADDVSSGAVTKAVEKQLDELLLSPERVSQGLTPEVYRDALQAGARRTQFHPGATFQIGTMVAEQPMRTMVALQPYGVAAWQSAQDDILEPLMSSDPSLRALGAKRLGRGLAAGAAAEGLRETIASLIRGKSPSADEAKANFLGTAFGTPGQLLGSAMYHPGSDPRFSMVPPIVGVPGDILRQTERGNWDQALVDLAALADPSGAVAMARPTIKSLLKDDEPRRRRRARSERER